ncbi:type II toxin-antitoxin system MqsA family antitoxin [Ancylothrix sp. C2]|uniref:type II toxin-antitoxin system MqsA family antitoxin n=1 Tax=Ancylothrix sp. D3o TaxID=2953691 RepID=UPI0021BAC557|nr:type II toxin-antitoxin system MqsA family antitoxin [Ancylothrix sp. D3o]MCT7951627.1 type II toxin-antitoxin system MqsA family antitoxin [Ancylothrix sp. D3o]
MQEVKCNFCGTNCYEERIIEYLYSYEGKYLLVPNMPVEVCLDCGMIYYPASVLKEIEKLFFAIHNNKEKPDSYLQIPMKTLS